MRLRKTLDVFSTRTDDLSEMEVLLNRQQNLEQTLYPDEPELGCYTLVGFGTLQVARGQSQAAELTFREVLACGRKHLGALHPTTLAFQLFLGQRLLEQERYEAAEPLLLAVLPALEIATTTDETLPFRRRVARATAKHLSRLYEAIENDTKAEYYRKLEEDYRPKPPPTPSLPAGAIDPEKYDDIDAISWSISLNREFA